MATKQKELATPTRTRSRKKLTKNRFKRSTASPDKASATPGPEEPACGTIPMKPPKRSVTDLDAPSGRINSRPAFSPPNDAVSVTATAEEQSRPPRSSTSRLQPISRSLTPPVTPTPTTPRKCRSRGAKSSPYFPLLGKPKSPEPRQNTSCIPFPPLTHPTFGLIQERLADQPFNLLLATIFLNKTRGAVALPVFYDLLVRYPTIQALADAKIEDVIEMMKHLGLQNARGRKIVGLARTWLETPPEKGKRWRMLHYPRKSDGADVGVGECLRDEEVDERVGWEVAHLPGIGAYGVDSWRIFCRDQLRGVETKEGEEGEWARVVPGDKELRAYLRWRWLRLGWVWDPITGERTRADDNILKGAREGGVMVEGEEGKLEFGVLKNESDEPT